MGMAVNRDPCYTSVVSHLHNLTPPQLVAAGFSFSLGSAGQRDNGKRDPRASKTRLTASEKYEK
jgi:hypothetical protein